MTVLLTARSPLALLPTRSAKARSAKLSSCLAHLDPAGCHDRRMGRRVGAVAVGVVVGAVCVAFGVFLHGQGVDRAGAWAGIIGLLGVPLGVLGVWLAWPRGGDGAAGRERAPQVKTQHNTASGGATVNAVQDGNQIINLHGSTGSAGPVPPAGERADESGA
jgi:hypothetical protein